MTHKQDKYLERLLTAAKTAPMSPKHKEAQRRSFAYGNTKIENERISREMVDREAEKLESSKPQLRK